MNKGDLISAIAAAASITKAQATDALNATLDSVTATLKGGGKVTLVGFGSFSTTTRKSRKGRNPKTGESILIPEKKVVKFKSGTYLSDSIN